MIYYLDTYKGKGTEQEPYRPASIDTEGPWSSIDLRPPGAEQGLCLVSVDDKLRGAISLGDDLDDLTLQCRRSLSNHLSINLHDRRLRRAIMKLLTVHGNDRNPRRWNRLRPEVDGYYRVWLGGLVDQRRLIYGDDRGSLIVDSFQRADNTNISTGAPFAWTEVLGDCQISGNGIRNVSFSATHILDRAEVNMASPNHYCAGTPLAITTTTGQSGVAVRMASASPECYVLRQTMNISAGGISIVRFSAAAALTLLNNMTPTVALTGGRTAKLIALGSSLVGTMGGVDVLAVTDTVISANLRCGFYLFGNGGTLRQMMFGWSAGDFPTKKLLKVNNGSSFVSIPSKIT